MKVSSFVACGLQSERLEGKVVVGQPHVGMACSNMPGSANSGFLGLCATVLHYGLVWQVEGMLPQPYPSLLTLPLFDLSPSRLLQSCQSQKSCSSCKGAVAGSPEALKRNLPIAPRIALPASSPRGQRSLAIMGVL